MEQISQDLRYALRTLRKQPSFTALAVLALALGIGATTTIFSVIQNVLLNPFPYVNADRVVMIQIRDLRSARPGGRTTFPALEFLEYQAQVLVFEDVIAGFLEDAVYKTNEGTELFAGGLVTANTFEFLGVPAAYGRVLTAEDAKPGAAPAFVMSHKMWMSHFNGDPSIIGRSFVINGVSTTLVGIMPPRFTKMAADVYSPLVLDPSDPKVSRRSFMLQARLKPGVTLAQAEAHIAGVAQRIAKIYPRNYPEKFSVKVLSWVDWVVGDFRQMLFTLATAVALLLLIACSNVANMLLSRAAGREKEMAIRASLGASRGRLVGQLLTESFLLALMGAVVGSLFAYFGLKALVAALPQHGCGGVSVDCGKRLIPRETVLELNLHVLAFSLAVAVLTAMLFGLVPALQTARRDLVKPLRDSTKGASGSSRGSKLTGALVVVEVALSLVLMVGAGLLMRTVMKMQAVDLGFSPQNVLAAHLALPPAASQSASAKEGVLRQVLTRLRSLPGVVSATAVSSLPPYGGTPSEIEISGKSHTERWDAIFQLTGEGYFPTLRRRLLRGRVLTEADVNDARKVAVVNRNLVEKYFGQEDPIGRSVTLKILGTMPRGKIDDPVFQIVGVVADARNQGVTEPIVPEVIIPQSVTSGLERKILIRTVNPPLLMLNSVKREVWAVDRSIAMTMTDSLENFLQQFSYAEPRFNLAMLSVFAAVGLVLVALGVYSVIAYRVSRQTQEIGVRVALGATRTDVLRLVLSRGLRLVLLGIVVGLFATLLLTRLLADRLFDVAPHDPLTLVSVIGVVLLAGAAACYFPARRATHVQPMTAMRGD